MTIIKHFRTHLLFILLILININNIQSQQFKRVDKIVGLEILKENNGAAVADFDGDLDLDIFIVAKAKNNQSKPKTISRLYRNESNGTFVDVTKNSGLLSLFLSNTQDDVTESAGLDGFKNGVSWGDYDNDGFPDLFLTYFKEVQLFHNEGDGTFKDVTNSSGILQKNNCQNTGAVWFDANNDGFLDLYISDWGECTSNTFYLNNGNGTFIKKTNEFFGNLPRKSSYQAIPFDFNNDGWMDLYVSEDFEAPNSLFINNQGKSFTNEANGYNLDNKQDDMGIAIGDYNNDGFFDFYIATIDKNPLFKNKGNNTFSNESNLTVIENTGWAWGPIFADFDLDGDEDLYVTNGFKQNLPAEQENFYFKNLQTEGKNIFENNTEITNLKDVSTSVTPIAFDYDNDGDLDLFVTNSNKESHLYENKTLNSNTTQNLNWFQVALKGTKSNRNAIGAIVSITAENSNKIHRNNTHVTHLSQSLKPIHFGLGSSTKILEITIKWPSGILEKYTDFSANKTYLFTEEMGFEEFKIPLVVKKRGCMDPFSCNYDPEAIINDGSCTYLQSKDISGNINSTFLKEEQYSYTPTSPNSSFNWEVNNGEIISGYGTNSITVKWHIATSGSVSVRETSTNCSTELITKNVLLSTEKDSKNYSVARLWNETLLSAIRNDFARPTVHARNLFHTSIAFFDSWAIFNEEAKTYLIGNNVHGFTSNFEGFTANEPKEEAIDKTLSYAAYRLLSHRFKNSPNKEETQQLFDFLMQNLGYDTSITTTDYSTGNAAALGNYIAQTIIDYGLSDGARELNGYDNEFYEPVNNSLFPEAAGNPHLNDPNRWQPLNLIEFVDQSGNLIQDSKPEFLSPEWGNVNPFSLEESSKKTFTKDGNTFSVYLDPNSPPYSDVNTKNNASEAYKWGFSLVSIWGSHLDPSDNIFWDISPKSIGNIDIENMPDNYENYNSFYDVENGGDIGKGRSINPYTNSAYKEQLVPRGDYTRVLAEFWADGPDSETPPGHWFTILNYVNDNEIFQKKLEGKGNILNSLEWDVKSYFILGGAMHDAAISAWSIKGYYDYIRPISAIRYMAELGQSSDSSLSNYNIAGIPLKTGYVEVVKPGDTLEGKNGEHINKIKLYTWRGPDFIEDVNKDTSGVGWILAENWWPYQRPNFVTPPFAGYVSGHSTYSRAAAEVMTLLTGDEYFPGGMGEFIARKNEFLVFEQGPSVDVKLQWATYRDASDQCSLSRIWGGIHPPADDIPGRLIGEKIGKDAFEFALPYFKTSNLGISKNSLNNSDYKIFPNPISTNNLFITNTYKDDNFEIIDLKGSVIKINSKKFNSFNNQTEIILPKDLSFGVYILKINNHYRKFIKN